MTRVAIQPNILKWARERTGLTPDDLRKSFPKIDEWEDGRTLPTLKQLERFAKKTWTPFGYFFLLKPPKERLPIPDFRTVKDRQLHRPSPNLLETIHTMQRRQAWLRDYLIEEGFDPLPFIASNDIGDDPADVARSMRKIFGIAKGWAAQCRTWTDALLDLRFKVEDAGITTVWNGIVGNHTRRRLDVDEFRGFVLTDDYAPLVFVNTRDAKAAQMFTLVHEIAHLWLGKTGVLNFEDMQPADNKTEKFCNLVAAEFLVPKAELKTLWLNVKNMDDPFQTVARNFKVSPLVAARRVLDLGYIDSETFFGFYNAYMKDVGRKLARQRQTPGGDFYATIPLRLGRPFAEAVVRATQEGRLLYRNAYQLTGLHGDTFDKLADKLEGEMF
jgi:Zn-dependent peptidase ImmA (M78 family)